MKYVHYGDIHTSVANEIGKNNNLPFINETYKESDELKLDDVIVAGASEDYKGIADAAVIIDNLPYTIIAGLHTIALRPTSLIKGYFLYYIFKTENFKRFGYKIGTGLKVFGISYNNLAKYKVYYPQEIEEQEKIIGILSNLTNSINLHERKCEELTLIKKSLLQKLFPKEDKIKPEIRYKNFSDAWEQRKLGEVATFINGRAYKQNELLDSGKYKVLRVGNFYTNDSWYYSNLELADKYYIDEGDLVYTWSATFGPHIWNGEKVIYHYHIWKIELSKFLDRDFTLQILEADKAKLLANTNGSTMIHVTKKDMESKVISLPNIEEQKKIGSYLMKFDSLITLHQRKLEKLKQLKKFLLQNMFI
ncbi:restriction endonuclease subunit S [Ligilactobacillus salivarius]|uniref:restriction endonuclease subunit S n=1 Tax=Ligilactobacillus salivarius TaxID=1624 RepID=UPI003CFFE769